MNEQMKELCNLWGVDFDDLCTKVGIYPALVDGHIQLTKGESVVLLAALSIAGE